LLLGALALCLGSSALARSPLVGDVRFPDRGDGTRDTGAFTGRIAVAVLLLESTGESSKYDWDAWRAQKVIDEMDEMRAWWNVQGQGQGLLLVPAPDYYGRVVEIGLEPLDGTHNSMHECQWDSAAMSALGFGDQCLTSVAAFNEAIRQAAGATEAATIFVLDDGETQATFPGGGTAWAWWGGPSCQVTWSNGGWGSDTLAMVAGHELAHVFHAFDEYSQPGYSVCSCDESWNGCANLNCQQASGNPCGGWHDICVMAPEQEQAWAEHHLCTYTTCHLGWVCVDESCNGQDDDCDGAIDEDLGMTACGVGACAHDAPVCVDGVTTACNPLEGASDEVCNGLDDDCDGYTDTLPPGGGGGGEGEAWVHCDADGDGYCDAGGTCTGVSAGCPEGCGDCDDTDPDVHEGRLETCNGRDDDCDGVVDNAGAQGCTLFFADVDVDGAGADGSGTCLCAADAAHPITTGGDCDDGEPGVKPGADEVCNGRDDDCDGRIDPGCESADTIDSDAATEEAGPAVDDDAEAPGNSAENGGGCALAPVGAALGPLNLLALLAGLFLARRLRNT